MTDTSQSKLTGGDDDLTFFSIPEVAKIFGVTVETIRNWIRSGDLPAMKMGNRIRISRRDLIAYSKQKYVQPGEDQPSAEHD